MRASFPERKVIARYGKEGRGDVKQIHSEASRRVQQVVGVTRLGLVQGGP
jgi:hypothetical protein